MRRSDPILFWLSCCVPFHSVRSFRSGRRTRRHRRFVETDNVRTNVHCGAHTHAPRSKSTYRNKFSIRTGGSASERVPAHQKFKCTHTVGCTRAQVKGKRYDVTQTHTHTCRYKYTAHVPPNVRQVQRTGLWLLWSSARLGACKK